MSINHLTLEQRMEFEKAERLREYLGFPVSYSAEERKLYELFLEAQKLGFNSKQWHKSVSEIDIQRKSFPTDKTK